MKFLRDTFYFKYELNPVKMTSYVRRNDELQDSDSSHEINIEEVISEKSKQKLFLAKIRSFIIVFALSVHSIFEGMAIGKC